MTDRWHDPAVLRQDHDIALRLLDRQGLVRCTDQQWVAEAKRLFLPIVVALRETIMGSCLSLVYVYNQRQQPANLAKNDGYSSVSERQKDGRRVASIGVSVQALKRGEEYASLVLLHELTHVLKSYPVDHGVEFHRELDRLIAQYNQRTGGHVVNDRYGLPMRYDCRSYDPFETAGAPPPPCVGGRAFRTEALQDGRGRP